MSNILGKKIVEWRKSNDCTQAALAERLCISKSYLCQIEKGTRVPSIALIKAITSTLLLSPDDIGLIDHSAGFHFVWCGTHVDNNGQYDVFRKVRT